jgi:tetratricopeptide (TPR) repeat protein
LSSTEIPYRLAPTRETVIALFARSGNKCAFPGCDQPLIDDENIFVGQICHIEGVKGERFNPAQNNEDRRQYDNLILLCYPHHRKTDNEEKYPVKALHEIKAEHEKKVTTPFNISESTVDLIIDEIKKDIKEIKEGVVGVSNIVSNSAIDISKILSILEGAQIGNQLASNESHIEREINSIMSLQTQNGHKSAIVLLLKLKTDKWNELNDAEKYKLLANLGICYLSIYEEDKAANHFIESLQFNLKSDAALSLAALGYEIDNKTEEAKKLIIQALDINPKSILAYSVKIAVYKNELDFQDLLESIPIDLREKCEIAYGLGRLARKKGDFHNAIKWTQISLDSTERNTAEIKAFLGATIIESANDQYAFLSDQITNDTTNKLRDAIRILTEAWDEVKDSELRSVFSWILLNRGTARKILKQLPEAYEDIKEANKCHSDYESLKHLALIAFENDKYDEVFDTLSSMEREADVDQFNEVNLLRAEVYLKKEDLNGVKETVNIILKNNPSSNVRVAVNQILTIALVEKKNFEEAVKICKTNINSEPENIHYQIQAAKVYLAQGEKELAKEHYDKAYGLINDHSEKIVIQMLAVELYKIGQVSNAIKLLERITDLDIYSDLSLLLIKAYNKNGDRKKVLDACNSILKSYGPISQITELKSHIYESIKDFPNAIATCEEYLKIYPDDQYIKIRLALIYGLMQNFDKVKSIIKDINHIDTSLPYLMRFQLALLFYDIGDGSRSNEIAYETRRDFFNIGDAHMKYVGFSMQTRKSSEDYLNVEIVSRDIAVKIENETQTQSVYIIEERDVIYPDRNELKISDELAQKLLSKKTGDIVEISGSFAPIKLKIISVMHKYVYAFQQSMQLLGEKFTDTKGLQTFTIGSSGNTKEDLKPIFDGLDQSEKRELQIRNFYIDHKLTIGAIANFQHVSPIKIWGAVVTTEEYGIFTSGPTNEYVRGKELLNGKTSILIDLISLLTLNSLKKLQLLNLIPNAKVISQSTIDLLNNFLHDLNSMKSDGFMNVSKIKGNYVRTVITKEDIEEEIQNFTNLVDWCKQNLKILPCNEALNINSHKKEELDNLIGDCFADSILTAREKTCILLCEESLLRHFAKNENSVEGISLFLLFNYLRELDLLTKEELDDLIFSLISLNYKDLPVDSGVLLKAAVKAKYQLIPPFTWAVKGIASSYFSIDYSVKIAVDFFYKVFSDTNILLLGSSVGGIRQNLVLQVLTVLKDNFDLPLIQSKLLEHIPKKFKLLQPQKDELLSIIKAFIKINIL